MAIMNIKLMLAYLVLCSLSIASAQAQDKTQAEVQAALMKAVGQQPGNFLAVRNTEEAVVGLRVLAKLMKDVQDNVEFDRGNSKLDKVKDMMTSTLQLKVDFETTIGQIMGGMASMDTHIQALVLGTMSASSQNARTTMGLDEELAKMKKLKKFLDQEVKSTTSEFEDFLSDWCGAEIFEWIKKELEKLQADIVKEEKEVEKLAKEAMQAEMEAAENNAKEATAKSMINWVQGQDDKAEDERQWNKNMQFTKMMMDAASGALNVAAGPISLLNFKSKSGEPAPMPERPAADILSAAERGQAKVQHEKDLAMAQNTKRVYEKKAKDAYKKVQKAEQKLRKLEQKKQELDRKIEQKVRSMSAYSVDHAKHMINVVTQFFYQKKNLMALATSIELFYKFIDGWHKVWQQYDGMPKKKRQIYLTVILSAPNSWGVVAPEIWSSVQVFPDFLQKISRDPFSVPEAESQVATYRDSIKALNEARDAQIAGIDKS